MTTCAYCGHDTIDAHQIEVCASCCACREDLAGEVLAIADELRAMARKPRSFRNPLGGQLAMVALSLTQLAARLSRTGEAVRDE